MLMMNLLCVQVLFYFVLVLILIMRMLVTGHSPWSPTHVNDLFFKPSVPENLPHMSRKTMRGVDSTGVRRQSSPIQLVRVLCATHEVLLLMGYPRGVIVLGMKHINTWSPEDKTIRVEAMSHQTVILWCIINGAHVHLKQSRVQGRLNSLQGMFLSVHPPVSSTGPKQQQIIRVDET